MRAGANLTSKRDECRLLVILFGTLEFDGRAQRIVEILKHFGRVTVVDINDERATQVVEAADVHRFQVSLPKHANKIGRHLLFWLGAWRTARSEKVSVVVAEDFFTTFPGCILSMQCRAKLIYDAHELIIPDPNCLMSKRDRFWYLLERCAVRRADLVIAANEERASLMAKHYGLRQIPTVMRNIPESNPIHVTTEVTLRQWPALSRRAPNEVLLLYQGDLSPSRGIDRFVLALGYLGPEFRMLVVGGGPDEEHLRAIGRPFIRDGRLVTLGRVEHRLLPLIAAMADVGIVTYPFDGLNNIYCASNKIFEYAQSGLPVVSTNQPPLRHVIQTYGIGRLVGKSDSPEQLASVIRDVAKNKPEYTKALPRLLEDYNSEDESERVRAVVDSILNESGLI